MDMKTRREASKAQFCGIESGGEGSSSVSKHKWRRKESARAAQRAANQHVRCKEQELVNTGLGVDPAQRKLRHCLIHQIHSKLRSLEQDMNLLKKIVLSCAEERAELMNEIGRLFHNIKDCSADSETGATSFWLQAIFNPRQMQEEDRSRVMGLLEVLLQRERSSSVPPPVTREIKVDLYRVLAYTVET